MAKMLPLPATKLHIYFEHCLRNYKCFFFILLRISHFNGQQKFENE